MRKILKFILPAAVITVLVIYGIYWAFFDLQRIKGQEILQTVPSPNGSYTITIYLNNGGATTDFATLCSVRDDQSGKSRNIYWQYHCTNASVQWLDNDTAVINGIELDVWKESYDYRDADVSFLLSREDK